MSAQTKSPMIGSRSPYGPGGRDCACCGEPPKSRKTQRRSNKRSERQRITAQIKKEAQIS